MRKVKSTVKQTATLHNVESDLLRSTGSSAIPVLKPLIEKLHLKNLLRFEAELAKEADLLFTYSQIDLQTYRKIHRNGNWSFTTGGADVRHRRPAPEIKDARLLLLGSWNYQPNLEGLEWFISRVRAKIKEKTLITVAGSHASSSIRKKINEAGMTFIDTPVDLEILYNSHAVAAVPLLSGSGTRGRILEAASFGRAVVTTPKGIEGLEFESGEGVLIADSSDEFARKSNLLLENPREREIIATRGYNKALAVYDWKAVADDQLKQWRSITGGPYSQSRR
jgi:glycosyltransferase involved in cell wall biosynthesis